MEKGEWKHKVKMGRGNDAIPTWSGFNYQGKMLLLCVLQKINDQISKGNDIDKYSVELERIEDFIISKANIAETLYQVKATLSKSKCGEYSEALSKLLDHRNQTNNKAAKCTLVVAKDISDWDDKSNSYRSSIDLYKYESKVVSIDEVKGKIEKELESYLINAEKHYKNIDAVYGDLCVFLDERVARMHKQGHGKRKYTIEFSDFVDVIDGALAKIDANADYIIKEKAYDSIIQTVKSAMNSICNQKCGKMIADCDNYCTVREAHKSILALPDLTEYCRIINPHRKIAIDDCFSTINAFPKNEIESQLLYVFNESNNSDLFISKDNMLGMNSAKCKFPKGMIIPTLLEFSDRFASGNNALQQVFQRIKENDEVYRLIEGNSIVADGTKFSGDLTQAKISSAWSTFSDEIIHNISPGIEILSLDELIDWFKNEGGNHE